MRSISVCNNIINILVFILDLRLKMKKEDKEKILDRLEGKKIIELGKCPYCNSNNYSREINSLEDFTRADCFCDNCKENFTEYFGLDEIQFEENDEIFTYNNVLSFDEKNIIKEWAEEQIEMDIDEDYQIKLKRIINIMNGEVNED